MIAEVVAMSKEWKPSKKSLVKISTILKQYEIEGAMTLRRCYYVLVGKNLIKNSRSSYIQLSKLFKAARINNYLPYECIIDSARNIYKRTTYSDFKGAFKKLCKKYRRDSLQDQEIYLEAWIEKEAIANLIYPITHELDIPLVVSKGFTSVTFKKEVGDRINAAAKKGKRTIILFISDFDAEGEYIPKIIKKDLSVDYNCMVTFHIVKVLLNYEDISKYDLISNTDYKIKPKQKEKEYVKDFISKYGEVQYELDALPSNVIQEKLQEVIEEHIDVKKAEDSDKNSEEEVKQWIKDNLKEVAQE